MPYIKQELRDVVDPEINALIEKLRPHTYQEELDICKNPGLLNYMITKIVADLGLICYTDMNNVIGALECVKLELYRRVAIPYEDKKIEENGDVYHA